MVLAQSAEAGTQRAGSVRTEAGNGYYASAEVVVNDSVVGDLLAAGGSVTVLRTVGADAAIAGGKVLIHTDVGQDLRVAGGNVEVRGNIGADLAAAGSRIAIDETTTVGGSSFVAGGDVNLNGRLTHGAKLYANRVVIGGQINGDTRIYARQISFRPTARIDGNLYYASEQPIQEEDLSKVSGRVLRERTPDAWDQRNGAPAVSWFHPFFLLTMLACGIVLHLIFPNAMTGARDNIASAPLRSVTVGLALLFTLPPVGVLLIMTLVGIPLGLGLFALYPFLLLLGYLATAFVIGQKIAIAVRHDTTPTRRRQALYLAVALFLLGIVGALPILGWLVMFLAVVAGIGGWALWGLHRYRTPDEASTAA
jgi:cytoskeletal protein CcmA (bactofilin family)